MVSMTVGFGLSGLPFHGLISKVILFQLLDELWTSGSSKSSFASTIVWPVEVVVAIPSPGEVEKMSQSFLGEFFLPRRLVVAITPSLLMTIMHELSSGGV